MQFRNGRGGSLRVSRASPPSSARPHRARIAEPAQLPLRARRSGRHDAVVRGFRASEGVFREVQGADGPAGRAKSGLTLLHTLSAPQRQQAISSFSKTGNNNLTEAFKDNVVIEYAGLRTDGLTTAGPRTCASSLPTRRSRRGSTTSRIRTSAQASDRGALSSVPQERHEERQREQRGKRLPKP